MDDSQDNHSDDSQREGVISRVNCSSLVGYAWLSVAAATLEADGQHLMTDVWTSAGVIGGLLAVTLTGWQRLDPILAIAVAANIVWSGYRLVQRSVYGLIDTALPADEREAIAMILKSYEREGILFHALRTRQAAARRFVSMHVLVPGNWSVQRGHQLLERLE